MTWMVTASDTRATETGTGLELAAIERTGTNQLVLRDRTIFTEGDPAKYAYRILSGVVRTYTLMPDGRRHVADFLMAGDLLSFEPGETYGVSAQAVVDCVVRRFPRASIDTLVGTEPAIAKHLLTLACGRLADAHTRMVALGRKTAEERLASFLLNLIARGKKDSVVALPMGRADIADHLGLTIETVSRLLSRLRRDGIIDLPDPHSFVVNDRAALEDRSSLELAA